MRFMPYGSQTASLLVIVLMSGCASISQFAMQREFDINQKINRKTLAARDYEAQGDLVHARELYEELLILSPDNPEILHRQGVVHTRMERFSEAKVFFERARRQTPNKASLLTDIGHMHHLRGNHVEAERVLREAFNAKPNDKRAATNLALAIGMQGRINESFEVLKLVYNDDAACCAVAYIHSLRKENDLAIQMYERALEANPSCTEASKALFVLTGRERSGLAKLVLTDVDDANSDSDEPVALTTFDEDTKSGANEAEWIGEPRLSQPVEQTAGRVSLVDDETDSRLKNEMSSMTATTTGWLSKSSTLAESTEWDDDAPTSASIGFSEPAMSTHDKGVNDWNSQPAATQPSSKWEDTTSEFDENPSTEHLDRRQVTAADASHGESQDGESLSSDNDDWE